MMIPLTTAAVGVGGAVLCVGLAPFVAPPVLGVPGFGSGGVAAGSYAAGLQASIGNVGAGSWFASAQSVGAGGALPVIGKVVSAGVGAAAAVFVGA
ncbi:hypothetical protein BS47DRAFT_1336190 [Hydnum rufescens UP504]|uniref:Uncharacterized protein n=1 Tax=Hydnum rufescens UP504 TaxID=1448309 RepID=A0A9P6BCI7_9AGAM|nr:hypothetical protein BS47DRAFT_1336190 [Hydnum rufescens UP504]